MKKTMLLLTISAISSICGAQSLKEDPIEDCREKMMVGIKAGANSSNVYGTDGENFHANSINGFAGGVFINIPAFKMTGVQAEILYAQKGFHATGNMTGGNYDFTRRTNFIDIPVLLAFMPVQYFSLLVGPQYSYLISQRNDFKSGTNSDQEYALNADNSRKNNFCFVVGFDANYKHFVLSGRRGWGLEYNNGTGTAVTPNYKNNWYQATIGYRFNIKNFCGNDAGAY